MHLRFNRLAIIIGGMLLILQLVEASPDERMHHYPSPTPEPETVSESYADVVWHDDIFGSSDS